ncbi:MAG: TolC family protein, partial [Candidatus Edwardsbacteria bacterium]|nr:TolC family protein [Candidatus Edwardsbacteria bacterium]MBU1577739.1 TolC family protein [Candidatus Edwardsbacteria bacterium]MBU2463883.1 TolC family protein [Candidatus Edwardsbacteria bacterium]
MGKVIAIVLLLASVARAENLSLNQAIDIALKQNAGLKMVEYRVSAAEGQLMTARGYLVPQLSASGSIMRMNSLMDMKPGPTYYLPVLDSGTHASTDYIVSMSSGVISSDKIGNTYTGKLSASWPVYTGGKIWQGYQISRLNHQRAEESYDSARAGVIYTVKQAYYGLLLAQSAYDVTREAVSSIEKHVTRVQALYQKGMVSRYDLLRAEVQLSNMQPQLIRMQNAVELSRQSFNMVLNQELSAPVILSDSMNYHPVEVDSALLVKQALHARPEYKSILIRQRMVEKAKLISYASYQPTVALFADYSYSKGSGFSGSDEWQKNWDVGVSASWPLFDGGSGLGKIKEAKANAQQLSVAKEMVEDWIKLEVSANYLTLKTNQKAIFSQGRSVEQAQEALKIAQARYENGQATNLDVLD